MKYVFIVTGYNCKEKAQRCFESFTKLRTDCEWKAVFISDGDKELSDWLALNVRGKRPEIWPSKYPENRGAAFCRFYDLKALGKIGYINDEDVVCLVGMDDEIMPWAIDEIDKHYQQGKWMTYGNWVDQNGKMLPKDFDLDFNPKVHAARDYRRVVYRSTSLNTFKFFLFKQFTEDDFKFEGEWVRATTESNLMLSCLEMCGQSRIGIVKTPIYLYNRCRSDNARRRFGSAYQDAVYADVVSKPKRDLL